MKLRKVNFKQIGFIFAVLVFTAFNPASAQENTSDTTENKVSEEPFFIVEQQPEFPDGERARMTFLQENLRYPQEAIEKKLQGIVYLNFIVEADGSITYVEIFKSSGYAVLDNEAIRVIESMPKWIPAKQRGKALRVKFQMPVRFSIEENDKPQDIQQNGKKSKK